MNTLGRLFRLTTFGESHGPAIGGVIDGCPAGLTLDLALIDNWLQRRKGRSSISTPRLEEDRPQFLSGLFEERTTGTPLAFLLPNQSQHSADYDHLRTLYRPSHADYTYQAKYGLRDHRGGGRSSARETVVRVVAGAIAYQILRDRGIDLIAYTAQVGPHALPTLYAASPTHTAVATGFVGCPDAALDAAMQAHLSSLREQGDTAGGIVALHVSGLPAGIGSPLYAKLEASLAAALMGINAAKGVEVGTGFALATLRGSQANDAFVLSPNGEPTTLTNHSGGIQGGISNGQELLLRIVFKPIASIAQPQHTLTTDGQPATLTIGGRHDASVFPRVLPIVEAMAALTLVDELLISQAYTHP